MEGLIEALLYKGDPNVRLKADEALGMIGDPRAIGPLITACGDLYITGPEVRSSLRNVHWKIQT